MRKVEKSFKEWSFINFYTRRITEYILSVDERIKNHELTYELMYYEIMHIVRSIADDVLKTTESEKREKRFKKYKEVK